MEKEILSKINKTTTCWIWTGWVNPEGYGRVVFKGKRYQAHRLVYEKLVGLIPKGLQLDHLCRNKSCVNPEHLEPVTAKENTLRGNGQSAVNLRKTHCIRGHRLDGDNLMMIKRTCPRYETSK